MPVTLDETGNGQPALQVDDLGAVADQPIDLGVRSNREDGRPAHGNGFRFGARRIDGDDAAVAEDEGGGFASWRTLRAAGDSEHQCEQDRARVHVTTGQLW